MSGWTIASVLVFGIVAALPQRGAALSCGNPLTQGPPRVAPENGAVDVPRNARIWVTAGFLRGGMRDADGTLLLSLVDSRGESVETRVGLLRTRTGGETWVLTPTLSLLPDETYEVRYEEASLSHFTTSSWSSDWKPATPWIEVVSASSSFPPIPTPLKNLWWWVESDAHARVRVPRVDHFVLYDWDDHARIDPSTFDGQVRGISREPEYVFGRGPCFSNWPDAGVLSFARMRAATVDVTGAMSTWSEPQLVVLWPKWSAFNTVVWVSVLVLVGLVVTIYRLFRSV